MLGIDKHQNYPTKDLINIFIEYSSNDLDVALLSVEIDSNLILFTLRKKTCMYIYKRMVTNNNYFFFFHL